MAKWGFGSGRRVSAILAALLLALALVLLLASSAGADWGYNQEGFVKAWGGRAVKVLRSRGITARFVFFEDGSFAVVGCVSDGLCQD